LKDKLLCELPKNSREVYQFRLAEFKGHKFVDMRIYAKEDGKESAPTKKGLAISPQLWSQFRVALAQVEAAMIEQGWLDKEDLQAAGDIPF
jgi:hypothetical protein